MISFRLNVLLQELKIDQAATERGACLEALSTIIERCVIVNLVVSHTTFLIVLSRKSTSVGHCARPPSRRYGYLPLADAADNDICLGKAFGKRRLPQHADVCRQNAW